MERVKTLIKKLSEQVSSDASAATMLDTVKMLQSELLHLQAPKRVDEEGFAIVHIPDIYRERYKSSVDSQNIDKPQLKPEQAIDSQEQDIKEQSPAQEVAAVVEDAGVGAVSEEKIIEVLQVDEAEIEAELEEIKRLAEEKNAMGAKVKPILVFEESEPEDILQQYRTPQHPPHHSPHHKMNDSLTGNLFAEAESVNERLREEKKELGDILSEEPIKDLKKAISINDRIVYINELFKGDETAYERSIKTLNHFTIYPEAEYFIKRELKLRLQWDDKNPLVQQFDHLIKRRFSHR